MGSGKLGGPIGSEHPDSRGRHEHGGWKGQGELRQESEK